MKVSKEISNKLEQPSVMRWLIRQMTVYVDDDGAAFAWRFFPLIDRMPISNAGRNLHEDWDKAMWISWKCFHLISKALSKIKGFKTVSKDLDSLLKNQTHKCSLYSLHNFFSNIRLKYSGKDGELIEAGFWLSAHNAYAWGETPCRQMNKVSTCLIKYASTFDDDHGWEEIFGIVSECNSR